MWLDIIKERRKELGYTIRCVAEGTKLPERTVSRIFSGETPSPYADTLNRIADFLGITPNELYAESKAVVGSKNYAMLHEENETLTAEVEKLTSEIERLTSELSLVNAENAVLTDKVGVLNAENDILKLKLEHKEELLSLHNYYIKSKSND